MATKTIEERLSKVESERDEIKARSSPRHPEKRGWRWFVGIFADNPRFEEAARIGEEWRMADRPKDEEPSGETS